MRIVFDLQACQSEVSRRRGIGRYSLALLRAMAELRGDEELWIAVSGVLDETYCDIAAGLGKQLSACRFFEFDHPVQERPWSQANWQRRAGSILLRRHLARLAGDVTHVMSLFEGHVGTAVGGSNYDRIPGVRSVTLYDLIPALFPERILSDPQVYAWYFERFEELRNFDVLHAISESTRSDAIDLLDMEPDRIVNVSAAADECFRPLQISPERKSALHSRFGLEGPFVLSTGGDARQKNVKSLVEAFALVPPDVRGGRQLVIVCRLPDQSRKELETCAARKGLAKDAVILTGFVPGDDLVALYNLCDLFVLPSHYEGFGLPALEAMSCGVPTIGSNVSSIPEVIGRADALFDPGKTGDIAAAMSRVLVDRGFRQELARSGLERAARFTWKKTASRMLDAMREAVARKAARPGTRPSARPRRRIAYLSPLPPERSGISDYSVELLSALRHHFDIDLFVEDTEAVESGVIGDFALFRLTELPAMAGRYDVVLANFGGSEFHAGMYELLQHVSMLIVLHDFYLPGLICHLELQEGCKGLIEAEAWASHGEAAWAAVQDGFASGNLAPVVAHLPLSRGVIERAEGLVVHSPFVLELAREFYPDLILPPYRVIPQIRTVPTLPTERDRVRARLGFPPDDIVISSFGILSRIKAHDQIFQAFASIAYATRRRLRLVFVGRQPDCALQSELDVGVASAGLENCVEFTGHVDEETYQDYLTACDLAVQLRCRTHGETSRAVLDCLASGRPVIVNDLASAKDYPDDVVKKIPAEFSVQDIADAMVELVDTRPAADALGSRGRDYVERHHRPELVARQFVEVIEAVIARRASVSLNLLSEEIAEVLHADDAPPHAADVVAEAAFRAREIDLSDNLPDS